MLLLDTNVVSAAFKPRGEPAVAAWFDTSDRDAMFLSSITKAELLFGLAIMPAGRRKAQLAEVLWHFLAKEIRTEVLEFGSQEAEFYAEIAAARRTAGRPISQSDAQIASIARARNFSLVTRNVRDFEDCGIDLVNPWEAAA